ISDPTGITLQVIIGKRETPVNGTPVDFMNIYCDAWNGDPNLRPSIAEIRDKLNYIRMVPVYHSEKDINIGISSNDVELDSSKLDDADDSIQDTNLIATYRMMNKYEESLEDLNKSLEINPTSAFALDNREKVYKLLNKRSRFKLW
ncbi:24382_t:CDS:2, partial [Cetraspora pellucida]